MRSGCCFSHPAERVQPPEVAQTQGADRICVWFQKGKCRNGASCQFSHVQEERDGNVIVVRNLPKSADPKSLEAELVNHFRTFGYIARTQVKTDLSNRCRGFAFVVFDNVESVKKALLSSHPAWDIKCKVDLPIYIEGDTRSSRKTTAANRGMATKDTPLRFPFSTANRVLFVGEGDFSYTHAALECGCLDPHRAVATSYEPPRLDKNLDKLRMLGVRCMLHVDATVLNSLGFSDKFDVVVFNFPHTGEPSIERNRELLEAFFRSAETVLSNGGRIAVALKQTWPYSDWELDKCAALAGFSLASSCPFPVAALRGHGYSHTTTDDIAHQVEFLESAMTYEFVRATGWPSFNKNSRIHTNGS